MEHQENNFEEMTTKEDEVEKILADLRHDEITIFKINNKKARVQKGDPAYDENLLDLLNQFSITEDVETRNTLIIDVKEFFSNPNIRRNIGLKECRKAADVLINVLIENDGLVADVGRSLMGLLVQLETTIRQSEAGKMGAKIRNAREKASKLNHTDSKGD